MFGFDNTKGDASQPQGQPQSMSPLNVPDGPISTPPLVPMSISDSSQQQPAASMAADPIVLPPSPSSAASDDLVEPDNSTNDLLSIKQDALQKLSPLVNHLDQSPEEKFKTTMMMIQASDDQTLVSMAYEAANAISDEKTKAQALLDIINEINYFTQNSSPQG